MRVLPRALRPRLAVLFTGGVSVALVVAAVALGFSADAQFDAAVDTGLGTRALALQAARAQGDTTALRNDPLAEVLDPAGRVLVASSSLSGGTGGGGGPSVLLEPDAARRATVRRQVVVQDRDVDALGGALRVRSTPTGDGGALVLGSRLGEVHEAEARLLLLFAAGAPLLAVVIGAAGWFLARAALRPVAALTAQAAEISAADLGRRLPQPGSGDEIEDLARTLNGMLGRLEATVLRERQFVDDAAHELRTPVAVLRGELELAERRARSAPESVRETLRNASAEAARLGRLAEDLLVLAKQDRPRPGPSLGVPLLERAREETARLGRVHGLGFVVHGTEVLVDADERSVSRLLSNLVANADAAGARHVRVHVAGAARTGVRDGPGGDGMAGVLTVVDDGPGFPPGLLDEAVGRFVRGDRARTRGPAGSGAGLGLAIVAALAKANGGSLRLGNDPESGGARIEVELPATRTEWPGTPPL